MSDTKSDTELPAEEISFISRDMRPDSGGDECPVIAPDASRNEIRRRAGEVLGPLLRGMLGVEETESAQVGADTVCVRSEEVTFAEVEGEAVLLDLASGRYYSLNLQGCAVWLMLTGENDLGAVHGMLCRRFRVDAGTAWEDLTALVRDLCCEKLARLEAPTRAAL